MGPIELWGGPIPVQRRIFCNRSLNMATIKAVGFDMDYTLAQYRPETSESLVHKLTVEKLVTVYGYPEELYDLGFDWQYMIRGLTIDKRRGNILKVDRHKYVKVAHHGFRELSREERHATYTRVSVRDALDDPTKYTLIDTLFSLAEAYLYMQLVELKDDRPDLNLSSKSYTDLYNEVRGAVDLCHRDGSLKRAVAADPGKYIHRDPSLRPLLRQLRKSGKKTFLATNSLWDYTHVVMNFLLTDSAGPDKTEKWLSYFDVVVTGCGKPTFFTQRRPLFKVHTPTGMLYNTDGGSPMIPVGHDDLPAPLLAGGDHAKGFADGSKTSVFQGGFFTDLHSMLSVVSGAEVLYVGDHIYGDIVSSKKTLGWRTMLVLPELESELRIVLEEADTIKELAALRQRRNILEDRIERMEWQLLNGVVALSAADGSGNAERFRRTIDELKEEKQRVHRQHSEGMLRYHRRHHPVWGQVLKTSYQNSQFAHQIDRHACIYTSHVANMLYYSPDKNFRGRVDQMDHEERLLAEGPSALLSWQSWQDSFTEWN